MQFNMKTDYSTPRPSSHASRNDGRVFTSLIFIAVTCFLYSLYIAMTYAKQAPLDLYSFRQTQTALTAYWLAKNGFSLAYETPVAGLPWSIPFEFPIYQYIVALLAKLSGVTLNTTGRLVSYVFLVLCIFPASSITRSLKLPKSVFYIFTALLFSSPVYLYWGRTFMIETTTLFFSIVAIKYFIDMSQENKSYKNHLLFMLFITLSILQKATTGLPVLALLCFTYVVLSIKKTHSLKNYLFSQKILSAFICFGIPLAIGIIWTTYTDHIREMNGIGMSLTPEMLRTWNWGTLQQRLSFEFYNNIIWGRIFERNLSGILGIIILITALCSKIEKRIKLVIVAALALGFLPLFLFTNLHIVHDYYQTANIIFLLYAIAVSAGCVLNRNSWTRIMIIPLSIALVTFNYIHFSRDYLGITRTVFNAENSRDYAVSEAIKNKVPQDKYFIAFGNDWSSSFAYLSERKSFSVPGFFTHYKEIALHPEHYINEADLGAVVVCPPLESPTREELAHWASTGRKWNIDTVYGCYIATPGTTSKKSIV